MSKPKKYIVYMHPSSFIEIYQLVKDETAYMTGKAIREGIVRATTPLLKSNPYTICDTLEQAQHIKDAADAIKQEIADKKIEVLKLFKH